MDNTTQRPISGIQPHHPALNAIILPTKDTLRAAGELGDRQARYLVDSYYQIQEMRKAAANQVGAMERGAKAGQPAEPHEFLDWAIAQWEAMERQFTLSFSYYTEASDTGRWLRSITGIGPVLAANFLARLDVHPWKCTNPELRVKRKRKEKQVFPCPKDEPCQAGCGYITVETAGGFWRFAGLDPTSTWHEGELRPWNAALKVACWKAADSWVKLKNNPQSFYSRQYVQNKARYVERNERGDLADNAAKALQKTPTHKQRATYATGKLPDGQLDMMARRQTVKLFLSHLHEIMYQDEFGRKPPKPFVIEHGGHAHYIAPPGWPLIV